MKKIHDGIRGFTASRSIRWFGWGFCETLIPLLIFSFTGSFQEAGIVKSIYDIVFIASLPLISILADRIPAKKLLICAILLYPFIGLGYFLAGTVGILLPIILARGLNGIAWCLDSVGGNTYIRRYTAKQHLSKAFGYLESLPNFSWIVAALLSLLLVPFVPVQYLFLGIIPTAILGYVVLRKIPVDIPEYTDTKLSFSFRKAWNEIRSWNKTLWTLAILTFFIACIDVLGTFFIPLFDYQETGNIRSLIITYVVFSIPSVCALWFGPFVDKYSKRSILRICTLGVAVLLGILAFSTNNSFYLVGAFVLGILLVVGDIAIQTLTTTLSEKSRYGKTGGLMIGASAIGYIIGPIVIGTVADYRGINASFMLMALFSFALYISLIVIRFKRHD